MNIDTYNQDEVKLLLVLSRGAKKRVEIIRMLSSHPRNCHQIALALETSWWTIYKHLQRLEKAGVVKSIGLGRIQFYTLTSKGKSIHKGVAMERSILI